MAARKVAVRQSTKQEKSDQDQPLHKLFEAGEKLPIKERVHYFERLLEAGTIDEPEFVFLADWSIRDVLDDAPHSKKEFEKIYVEFGNPRLLELYRSKKLHDIREVGRLRFLAEREDKEAATADDLRCQAEDLAVTVASVLNNPACPQLLYDAIVDSLNEIQSRNNVYNVDFLLGLLLSKPRQAEGGAQ